MAFIKVIKTKAYYKRFQVKYRRRRCGKTDYRARLRLTTQDKNKYNTPKYRLIVRVTNRDVICQVAYATMKGDIIVAAAYSHELPKYGIKAGLTNYAACYATGLLCARRLLTKYGLADAYEGCTEPDGEDYNVEENDDGPRPFYCLLDIGLKRTSTGAKIFGALKGACDGGLSIPHNEKRFAGYDKDDGLDAEMMKGYIYGIHVQEYMESMEEEDPEKYRTHFKSYIDAGIGPDDVEDMYSDAHEKIRENPVAEKKSRSKPAKASRWKAVRLTQAERKAALKAKLLALQANA